MDWRKRRAAVAKVQLAISDTLDDGLPSKYDPVLYNAKCAAVFEHMFEKYPQANASVYAL